MGCGIKIVSNNLLNEVVFVSVTQENETFNLGEKTIPFNVFVVPGSNSISGTYNIYSSTYKTNYSLVVPDSINIMPCLTPTPTQTPSISITTTPTITSTPTISITQTPTISPTPSISITQTPSITITPTPSITTTQTPSITTTLTPTITQTPSISITQTPSITITPTLTLTPTISITQTPSIIITPTLTLTPTISITQTPSITITPTPTITPTNATICGAIIDYNGPEIYPYSLNVNIGTNINKSVTFEYSAYTIADRFILYYNDNMSYDTNYIGSFVYDYGQMYRESFTEHLMDKIDPITGLQYPNINATNCAPDGYPYINSPNEGAFNYVKTSTTEIIKVEVYSCAPLNIWTFKVNCPIDL